MSLLDHENNELRDNDAKKYNRIKNTISIIDIVITVIVLTVLAFSGISIIIVNQIEQYVQNPYLQFLLFLFVVGIASQLIDLPLDIYSSYILEHKYNLSNQTVYKWIVERIKSLLIGLCLGIPIMLVFYYTLRIVGDDWWLYFSVFVILVAIVLARIAPIIIFPLFYKFKQLENEEMKEEISSILEKYNINIKGIFTFNMSKDTKKANAGFTGIGKSKRIILSDTLVENFSIDEIKVIFAHELGHYTKKHIVKGIFLSSISILLSFYICGQLYAWTLDKFGFVYTYDIAAIPILFFFLSLFSLITMPLMNMVSRRFEIKADIFAVKTTEDKDSFISGMEKLAKINLADKEPNRIIEFLFYSHPSIKKRIELVNNLKL
ncbi:MAG: M48 family metallopeptidase [Spirochaetota bacterium]|nr:M48 family metallopeptidase [Spirochaetota bacterium]